MIFCHSLLKITLPHLFFLVFFSSHLNDFFLQIQYVFLLSLVFVTAFVMVRVCVIFVQRFCFTIFDDVGSLF